MATMTKHELRAAAERLLVPEHLIDGLTSYVAEGRRTGSYLESVLSDDYPEVLMRGDDASLVGLTSTEEFIHQFAPSECHGSRERVEAWIKKFAAEMEVRP